MQSIVATYVLIHGAGSDGWYWHLVERELRRLGHHVVAPDLPSDDDSASFDEYADAVARAVHESSAPTSDLVVVGQSFGGFTAPLVCDRLPVRLLVLVAAMVPLPGERAGEWWDNTGWEQARLDAAAASGEEPVSMDELERLFLHDVPTELWPELLQHDRPQSGAPFERPWPRSSWPAVPTRFVLCRDDRLFPAAFMRHQAQERLGIEADEMDGGHLPALSRPVELAQRLADFARAVLGTAGALP